MTKEKLKQDIRFLKTRLTNTRLAFEKSDAMHEKHMKIAENEISRLNIIIGYLETKNG